MYSLLVGFTLSAILTALSADAGGDDAQEAAEVIRARVSVSVGRPVDIDVTRSKTADSWTLICGDPVEVSGAPFEIERSLLAESEFGAHFCGLLRRGPDGEALVRFDIGSNDMPAIGWAEEHELPPSLLED